MPASARLPACLPASQSASSKSARLAHCDQPHQTAPTRRSLASVAPAVRLVQLAARPLEQPVSSGVQSARCASRLSSSLAARRAAPGDSVLARYLQCQPNWSVSVRLSFKMKSAGCFRSIFARPESPQPAASRQAHHHHHPPRTISPLASYLLLLLPLSLASAHGRLLAQQLPTSLPGQLFLNSALGLKTNIPPLLLSPVEPLLSSG